MELRVDLHLHTMASDGRWTPEELVAEVQRSGIGLFAATDHDSLGSLAQTIECLAGSGLRFLPGVEISARQDGQLCHFVAYGFDRADPALNALLEANQARLLDSNDEAIRSLIRAGYSISFTDYAGYTWDRRRGGWKALNFLIDRGLCRDVHSYFRELFVGDLAQPEPDFALPEAAIEIVRQAGGVVFLAHPGANGAHQADDCQLDRLLEMGLQGVECFSSYHDGPTTRRFLDYCHRRDLLVSGGSDCHGGFAGRALGVPAVHASDLKLGALAEKVVVG
jgi:predicted metal-dependent phosphoesterase TrpH